MDPMNLGCEFAKEAVADMVKDVAHELLKAVRGTFQCRSIAERLLGTVDSLLPVVEEVRRSCGEADAPPASVANLNDLADHLRRARDLARRAVTSPRWDVYRSAQLARGMEAADQRITRWIQRHAPLHALADNRRLRADSDARFGKIERRLEEVSAVAAAAAAAAAAPVVGSAAPQFAGFPPFSEEEKKVGVGMKLGKQRVKQMVMCGGGWAAVGISGIGGSGKTTLAHEICRDTDVRTYFNDRIFFVTVSQSPDVATLKMSLWEQITGNAVIGHYKQIPEWQIRLRPVNTGPVLVVLDDVWSLADLQELVFKIPGCKTLVVSRSKFPALVSETYDMELLSDEEALTLFCQAAFDDAAAGAPCNVDKKLVKEVVSECKGLPLALKVIGASLRNQPPKIWVSAKNRLSRAELIPNSLQSKLIDRMTMSVDCLSEKARECFLDLGCFPEDKPIPLDVLINIWMEIHDLEEEDAFAVLSELADRNLLTLVKDVQDEAGDLYSSYADLNVSQHDVLRDLALHINNGDALVRRKRLVMPRREGSLPREWERNKEHAFEAQIVSIHTGEMKQSDWFNLQFPKTEALILTFTSTKYFLPPFIGTMPNLKVLVLINYGTSCASLDNLAVFTAPNNLQSLWVEKIRLPPLCTRTVPLHGLRKVSLVLCETDGLLNGSKIDLSTMFPRLSDLTINHCIDLKEIPPSICGISTLTSISISHCHDLSELPDELGKLHDLRTLRVYACPELTRLPPSICGLTNLKYLNISHCVRLRDLPEELGQLGSLEKFDMRECSQLQMIPRSLASLKSLGHVVCDEEVALLWKEAKVNIPDLRVQVAEKCYNLDWLVE